jgi:outer membrane protein assembly factor BamC
MASRLGILTVLCGVLLQLSACSYIKSLFPDKGKDYQYTAEIPPLTLPAELKPHGAEPMPLQGPEPSGEGPANNTAAASIAETGNAAPAPKAEVSQAAAPTVEAVEKFEKVTVELIHYSDGENRLRLNVEKPRAWRLVSKALSRKSLEVTNRNQDEGFFVVQFDPSEQKFEDGTLWDEAVFLFKGFRTDEKEYVLKLEQYERDTEVIILDKEQQPLTGDEASMKLLALLQQTINADLAEKQQDKPKE